MTEPFTPRTEREHWVAIADALNAAHQAGMPVGIDLDGTLTDHRAWSVIWDRDGERWTVAGYDDDIPTGQPDGDWVRCCQTLFGQGQCPNAERHAKALERGWQEAIPGAWLCQDHADRPAPLRPRTDDRRAALLTTIRQRGGQWTTGRVRALYKRLYPGHVYRSALRSDLALLHRKGHLVRNDGPRGRYYTLATAEGGTHRA
ncbi:hypothetical protein PV350_31300 [Streptomyces sp. PA03-6a]|nr:hypothetical protein [Streptomyces sp. PA03-6a]